MIKQLALGHNVQCLVCSMHMLRPPRHICPNHPNQPAPHTPTTPTTCQLLVSGGWDRTLQVWDLRLARSVRSFFGPYICGDALDMRGGVLVTGSWRHANPLQLWDFGSGRLLTNWCAITQLGPAF